MQSGQGFGAGAPHGLQLSFGCQVICVLLLLLVKSHLIRGLALLSRHHSPSLSIVYEFNITLSNARRVNVHVTC